MRNSMQVALLLHVHKIVGGQKMKQYEKPEMEAIVVGEDVITDSTGDTIANPGFSK